MRADSFRGGEGAVGAWIDLISFEKRAQSGLDEIMNGFRDVMSIENHLRGVIVLILSLFLGSWKGRTGPGLDSKLDLWMLFSVAIIDYVTNN